MTRDDVFEAVREAAVEILKVDASEVSETALFGDDLGADSLDLVELVMQLEDELSVSVPEEDLEGVRTVSDALDVLCAKLAVSA